MTGSAPEARDRLGTILVFVFLGGALGSSLRELLVPMLPAPVFWGPILLVNVLASFLIGWLFVLRGRVHPHVLHFLVGGFCGGFSTFSHFSYELVTLGGAGDWVQVIAYIVLAVTLGIGAAVIGEALAQRVRADTKPTDSG